MVMTMRDVVKFVHSKGKRWGDTPANNRILDGLEELGLILSVGDAIDYRLWASEEELKALAPDVIRKIMQDNAAKLYNIEV